MKKKVLIVDDSASWRIFNSNAVRHILGDAWEITVAQSATDGLEKLEEHKKEPFRLIISDLQMELDYEPQTAGEWFIEHAQMIPEYSNSKIIIISSMHSIGIIASKLNVDFVSKGSIISNLQKLEHLLSDLT